MEHDLHVKVDVQTRKFFISRPDYHQREKHRAARRQSMPMEGWVEVPDRDYGSFYVIDTDVPHAGAIALDIGRSASISEVFRTIFPSNLVETVTDLHRQEGEPSLFS